MYFWSALIAFGVVAMSLLSTSLWTMAGIAGLVVVGVVLLRLPALARVPAGPPDAEP